MPSFYCGDQSQLPAPASRAPLSASTNNGLSIITKDADFCWVAG